MRSSPPGSRLTPRDIKAIVSQIAEMSYQVRPTWNQISEIALGVTRRNYTRQALSAHNPISEAYNAKVAEYRRFRDSGKTPRLLNVDEDSLRVRVRELEAEKATLQEKISALDKRVMLHVANAIRLGVSTRELEKPTEKPWKAATDETSAKKPTARKSRN